MRTLILAVTAITLLGCNDDELRRQNEELRAQVARLQKANEPTKFESFRVPQTQTAWTRETCTLEQAKKLHPDKVAEIEREQAAARAKFEAKKQGLADLVARIKRLPPAPANMGPAPTITTEVFGSIPEMAPFNIFGGVECDLVTNHGEDLHEAHQATDWRFLIANATQEWNEFSQRHIAQPEPTEDAEDFDSGILLTSWDGVVPGGNLDARKAFAERMVRLLAKGGPRLQWVVGLAMRFNPNAGYTVRRMERLLAATGVSFAVLDQQVREAEAVASTNERGQKQLPPEFRFDIYDGSRGGYYKGLLLRRWREHELFHGRGMGNVYIADVRSALLGVARGMGVTLD